MAEQATIYENCTIFTMDRAAPPAEALLVGGDRIVAVGAADEVESQADSGTRRVDLAGRTVVPGFNDCHCHVLSFGLALERLDVGADAVRSIEEIKLAVRRRAAVSAEGAWILGRGYDQNALQERRHITRYDLDEAAPAQPVVLWHTSGHALACNSRALELAGVRANTSPPAGGDIERDAHGEPTGVLKEAPATDLVSRAIPSPTIAQGAEAIVRAMEVMARQGVTSATDASTGEGESISPSLEMYRTALRSGRLAGRITLMPQILYVAPPDSEEVRRPSELAMGDQPAWLAIGATKIFSDGALTTRTAALREPYADDATNSGLLIWEPETLASMIRRAHLAGWQIGTHAIGDRAVELVVNCYERALAETPRKDHRHRIEHCMLLDERLGQRIKRLGLVPTIQPGFIGRLGDAYIAALGMERASQLMPTQLFARLGVPVGFSSDRPVIPGLPLQGIRAAVERRTPGGVPLGLEHAVDTLEAIRLYTAGSAFAGRAERERGMLRRGMQADFTVLSRNPAGMTGEELDDLRVTMTVVGGGMTFEE